MEDDGGTPDRGAPTIGDDVGVTRDTSGRRLTADHSGRDPASAVSAVSASLALPLTMLSALLYLVGFWSPWVYEFTTPGSGNAPISGSMESFSTLLSFIHYRPSSHLVFGVFGLLGLVWDALPICGILLSLTLWLRRAALRALVGVYVSWLLLATAVTGVALYGEFSVPAVQCVEGCSSPPFIIHRQVAWGAWLTLGVLLLAWVSLGALIQRRTDPSTALGTEPSTTSRLAPSTLPHTHSRSSLVGAGVYTLGVAIWAVGLLLAPWATAGCSGIPLSLTHLARGSCMGLDGYDLLVAGLVKLGWEQSEAKPLLAMYLNAYRIIELLLIAGVVLIVLLWRTGRARSMRAAVTVWMILVTLVFMAGWQGTSDHLGHPAALVFGAAAPWGVGSGVWICAVGIILGWAGCTAVWLRAR